MCSPIKYHNYKFNYGGPLRDSKAIRNGNNIQICATVLTDVCYRLYAYVLPCSDQETLRERYPRAYAWLQRTTCPQHAYQEMFNRCLRNGKSKRTPSLGWYAFLVSYYGPFRQETKICTSVNETIPSMQRRIFALGLYQKKDPVYDNKVEIVNGVLRYHERLDEVM